MQILGIGSLFSAGLGIEVLESSLEHGLVSPKQLTAPDGSHVPVYQVDLDDIQDRTLLKKIRRADKLSKMALLTAAAALNDANVDTSGKKVGIILATAFGAHVTTFDFLDGILDFGEANVSPTAFSNSVHNAAASYISSTLDIKGPTLTLTAFRFSFEAALQLAAAWLEQGRVDYLLAGSVEQYGDVLGYVSRIKCRQAVDAGLKPFTFASSGCIPGEGSVFFLLGRDAANDSYCRITVTEKPQHGVDLSVICADGIYADESGYITVLPQGQPVTAYSPLFGTIMTGSAFNIAAGALMLRRQKTYAAPEQTNPHRLAVVSTASAGRIATINCINLNCSGETIVTSLSKEA